MILRNLTVSIYYVVMRNNDNAWTETIFREFVDEDQELTVEWALDQIQEHDSNVLDIDIVGIVAIVPELIVKDDDPPEED